MARYHIAIDSRTSAMMSKLFVDGVEQPETRLINGVSFASDIGEFVSKLEAGSHMFRVQYRTAVSGVSMENVWTGQGWRRSCGDGALPGVSIRVQQSEACLRCWLMAWSD